jgi:ketosteroid isomerase-like protein
MSTDQAADAALLETFYACFAKRDYRGMAACYHPAVSFRDPVFNLQGKRVAAMWHMLCESGKDLEIKVSGIRADQGKGQARWEAVYTFSGTGRKVCNRIDSEFRFRDGKILSERDTFGVWRWSVQALGWTGLFLGWMPRLLQTVQAKARENLERFILSHPEYAEP